ncbi:MAG: cell division protein FtsX [Parvularculaceae bacterium]
MNGKSETGNAGEKERKAPKGGFLRRFRAEPLLPEAGAGGAPLTAVIAAISFLAALSLSGFIVISLAAGSWTSELRTELTIQVKGASAELIAEDVDAALRVLSTTEGVVSAKAMAPEDAAKLLEPWLGRGNVGAYLNVPALIEVKATPALHNDLGLLRTRLAAAAPGASIDDHGSWHSRLAAAARSGQALAFTVFLLVMGAACAISVFAARAGLAANHEIVSLLHLVGATDAFIANEVQRRFFILGFRGSMAGLFLALVALGGAALITRVRGAEGFFLPNVELQGGVLAWLLIVPAATCLVSAATARFTVLKTLRRQY